MVNITSVSTPLVPGKNAETAASLAGPSPAGKQDSAGLAAQTVTAAAVAAPAQTNMAEVQRAANRAQEVLSRTGASLKFALDDDTGMVVVKVVDTETDQVIRQMPSEEMLALARNMEKLQGLLVKREA